MIDQIEVDSSGVGDANKAGRRDNAGNGDGAACPRQDRKSKEAVRRKDSLAHFELASSK